MVSGRNDDDGVPPWQREEDFSEQFRPLWLDLDDEAPASPPLAHETSLPVHGSVDLLSALARAETALTKLETTLAHCGSDLRAGVLRRAAYREASGWLHHIGFTVHPHDLALRARGLTGSYLAAAWSGRLRRAMPNSLRDAQAPHDEDDIADDGLIGCALAYASVFMSIEGRGGRSLKLVPDDLIEHVSRIGGGLPEDEVRAWHERLPARHADGGGTLLSALNAAADWRRRDTHQSDADLRASIAAALLLMHWGRTIPLPLWSGRGMRMIETPFHAAETAFIRVLGLTEGAAHAIQRDADRLIGMSARLGEMKVTRRSALPAAVRLLIREPVVTPTTMSRDLRITHQASIRLLMRLHGLGVAREATGRGSFRAFMLSDVTEV